MRSRRTICATAATVLLGTLIALSAPQGPAVREVGERVLRDYTGVYRWVPNAFMYLQMWEEFN
jgi:hypothetical protein